MRRVFLSLIWLLSLAGCAAGGAMTAAPSTYGEGVRWYTLEEGLREAAQQNKPMVVDFFFPVGCSRCRQMVSLVYSHPEIVGKLNAEFIPIKIDLSRPLSPQERALGERFHYGQDCLLLFLDPLGEAVEMEGQQLCMATAPDSVWFLRYLDAAKAEASKGR